MLMEYSTPRAYIDKKQHLERMTALVHKAIVSWEHNLVVSPLGV